MMRYLIRKSLAGVAIVMFTCAVFITTYHSDNRGAELQKDVDAVSSTLSEQVVKLQSFIPEDVDTATLIFFILTSLIAIILTILLMEAHNHDEKRKRESRHVDNGQTKKNPVYDQRPELIDVSTFVPEDAGTLSDADAERKTCYALMAFINSKDYMSDKERSYASRLEALDEQAKSGSLDLELQREHLALQKWLAHQREILTTELELPLLEAKQNNNNNNNNNNHKLYTAMLYRCQSYAAKMYTAQMFAIRKLELLETERKECDLDV